MIWTVQRCIVEYQSHKPVPDEAIERIDRYTEDMGELVFLDNLMVQDAGES